MTEQGASQDDWPVVEAIVTYSQSTDPDSPHFSDMTQIFSDQEWVAFPYRVRDIKKNRKVQFYALNVSDWRARRRDRPSSARHRPR